jgi:hypothetical protein
VTESPQYTRVQIESGTRLEQLYSQYAALQAAADEATKRFDALKDAIKRELSQAAPEALAISGDCASVGLTLELSFVESWRLDAKAMKEKDPGLYVTYAKKTGAWVLKRGRA